MNTAKRNELIQQLSKAEGTLLVPIRQFFDGNDDLGSIGCNLTEHPGIKAFGEIFTNLSARSDVEAIYAKISEIDPGPESWPFSDTIIVFGEIPLEELKLSLAYLQADEIVPAEEFGVELDVIARHSSPALLVWWD